jgi:hypothetical protein
VITILVDHDIEGQATVLWRTLQAEGWSDLIPLQLVLFAQVGLPPNSSDRTVWRFAQDHRMILLTGNRRMAEEDALEQVIRDENKTASLPVLTIGNVKRMVQKPYRERCVTQLLEIVLELDNYLGTGRIFIP